MSTTDWKALLGNLTGQTGDTTPDTHPAETASDKRRAQTEPVVIRFERRGGKPTTIVSRVEGDPDTVGALAARLKKQCGTGGSFRDDEILIQGDVRKKVATLLQQEGFKVKGDY